MTSKNYFVEPISKDRVHYHEFTRLEIKNTPQVTFRQPTVRVARCKFASLYDIYRSPGAEK